MYMCNVHKKIIKISVTPKINVETSFSPRISIFFYLGGETNSKSKFAVLVSFLHLKILLVLPSMIGTSKDNFVNFEDNFVTFKDNFVTIEDNIVTFENNFVTFEDNSWETI